jgi:hypothetical protein
VSLKPRPQSRQKELKSYKKKEERKRKKEEEEPAKSREHEGVHPAELVCNRPHKFVDITN